MTTQLSNDTYRQVHFAVMAIRKALNGWWTTLLKHFTIGNKK